MARTIQEIEEEIARLPKQQLEKFRAWFEAFDSDAWDEQIENDAASGRLDRLSEAALVDHRSGASKRL